MCHSCASRDPVGVIPAQAGIQKRNNWIPAGMTYKGGDPLEGPACQVRLEGRVDGVRHGHDEPAPLLYRCPCIVPRLTQSLWTSGAEGKVAPHLPPLASRGIRSHQTRYGNSSATGSMTRMCRQCPCRNRTKKANPRA
jgi:hypothetical protein